MSANCVRAALAAALLALLAIVLAACGQEGTGQTGKNEEELADTGPNAARSNEELVSVAITNMKALKSHHLEFNVAGDSTHSAAGSLTVTLDVSLVHTSTLGRLRYVPDEDDGAGAFLGFKNYFHGSDSFEIDINISDRWYESYDGGKTWSASLLGEAFLPLLFAEIWGSGGAGTTEGERLLRDLAFKDGAPRLEMIDGVLTRHMSALVPELKTIDSQLFQQLGLIRGGLRAKSVEIWASTGITPTILQMRVEGRIDKGTPEDAAAKPVQGQPYTLTWTWSRFNEDLGEVKPPPADKIKKP